jgi:SAM-dependent methyltransferase
METMSPALADAYHYHRWILSLLRPWLRGDVLEVGVGAGQYSRAIAPHCRRLTLLDFDPQCLAALQPDLPGARFVAADLQDPSLAERIGPQSLDGIVCLNVLEHLERDGQALDCFARLLRPGGVLLLLVPAHPSLFSSLDRLAGHHRRYRRDSLRPIVERAGLQIERMVYINPIGALGWWWNARFSKTEDLRDPALASQILFYDRYIQPLSQLATPLTGRWFGQSLWTIARR